MPPAGTVWTAYVSGECSPNTADAGIGRTLLGRLRENAKKLRDDDRPELPGELKNWISYGRPSAAGIAAAARVTGPAEYFFHMRADPAGVGRPDRWDAQ